MKKIHVSDKHALGKNELATARSAIRALPNPKKSALLSILQKYSPRDNVPIHDVYKAFCKDVLDLDKRQRQKIAKSIDSLDISSILVAMSTMKELEQSNGGRLPREIRDTIVARHAS